MQIDLYMIKTDNNFLNKIDSNTTSLTLNGSFREELDILNPIFTINYDVGLTFRYNYCRIGDLNRYYYITGVRYVTNKVIELTCHVDVLMSYKDAILDMSAIVDIYSGSREEYLPNDNIIYSGRTITETHTVKTHIFEPITVDGKTVNPTSFILTGFNIDRSDKP